MRRIACFVISAVLLLPFTIAWAEELAPGYDKCLEGTETLGQQNVCTGQAAKYWSKKLDAQYASIRRGCNQAANPAECKNRLKKMQLGWLNYVNGIDDMIRNGLYQKKEITTTCDVDEALTFEVNSARNQYETLKLLEESQQF